MLDKLSDERKKEYKDSFEIYDIKKDGTIPLRDYENVLKLLKINTNEFKNIINEYNLKGIETIKFEDFITDINSMENEKKLIIEEKEDDEEQLIKAFKSFEGNKEGKISFNDFKEILKSNENGNIPKEEVEFLISQFGKDGYIDYFEFINALLNK